MRIAPQLNPFWLIDRVAHDFILAEPDDLYIPTSVFRTTTHGVSTRLYQWFASEDDDSGQWRRVSRGDFRKMREGRPI